MNKKNITFLLFGASGDLAKRKLILALFSLFLKKKKVLKIFLTMLVHLLKNKHRNNAKNFLKDSTIVHLIFLTKKSRRNLQKK